MVKFQLFQLRLFEILQSQKQRNPVATIPIQLTHIGNNQPAIKIGTEVMILKR